MVHRLRILSVSSLGGPRPLALVSQPCFSQREGVEDALRAGGVPPADPGLFLQLPHAHGHGGGSGSLEAEEQSGILETGPHSSQVS